MIVASLVAHPELLAIETEDFAALDLENADARALRTLLLDHGAALDEGSPPLVEGRIARAGLSEAAVRLAALVRPGDRWALAPHADPLRLENAVRQAVILHLKAGALNSELRQAERALVADETEANFAWLCDVKERLAVIAAAEAEQAATDA